MQEFIVEKIINTPDEYGGFNSSTGAIWRGAGFLDLITGSTSNTAQNASIEQSTHILLTGYLAGYKVVYAPGNVIVIDGERYHIDYTDNPVGLKNHLEIYLRIEQDG